MIIVDIMLFLRYLIIPTITQKEELIYILQWTYGLQEPWESWTFWYLEMGQESFVSRNCSFQNCFITSNLTYLNSIEDFDVLLFNIVQVRSELTTDNFPTNRSEHQLYIFVASEPAALNSISTNYDSFFNYTWTYKVASDIFNPFYVVKNNIGEVIGPKVNVQWIDLRYLPPTNMSVVRRLGNKHIAAAWVSAHCQADLRRTIFISNLGIELSKYGHKVDYFGQCGRLYCPRKPTERLHVITNCYKNIESDYYFYLAFENSFAEDYVSEKVLHGLKHFAVPIVFGGADYTRFLPDGSYVDASNLGAKLLAKKIVDIINDPPRYYNFFKWHGYYSFQDTTDSDHRESACAFCAFLNKQRLSKSVRIYHDMAGWWNVADGHKVLYITSTSAISTPSNKVQESDEKQNIFHTFFSNIANFFLDDDS